MRKMKGLAGILALAFAGNTQAFVLDFQNLADGAFGESAWQPLTLSFSEAGYSGTVSISGQVSGSDAFAYLDATNGSGRAGLGVCPKLMGGSTEANPGSSANLCDPSSDDNIRAGEQLTVAVDVTGTPTGFAWNATSFSRIWISNTHDGDGDVKGDTIELNGASTASLPGNGWFTGTDAEKANSIVGPTLASGSDLTISYGGDAPEQFYVSAMEILIAGEPTGTPIAGVLPLLGIGFAGLVLINRRRYS